MQFLQNKYHSKTDPLSYWLKIAFTIAVGLCFTVFFFFSPMQMLSEKSYADGIFILIISLLILLFCAVFFMLRVNIRSDVTYISLLAIAAAAIALRLFLFNAKSGDYNSFLSQWISQMRLLSGVKPITTPIGDYNMPYLYFLFFMSRSELYDLYLIKLLSVVFDFVLALGAVKLTGLFSKGDGSIIASFAAALFAPTLFLNSAYWAQCDGIYTALCVWALYFSLKNRPKASVVFFALAFSFKMQSIFIFPIIIFLILKHKISLKHLIYFPITFFLTLLPSLLCGRSFHDTFSIYIDQTSSYPSLTLNCPSLWAFFPEGQFETFGSAALFLAGGACLAFGVFVYTKRDKLTDKLLFDTAFIFTLLLPFLLPRMHERYFYLAEALSIIHVILHKDRIFVAPLIILTGFCVYSNFLFGNQIFELEFLSIINAAVILYICKKFADDLSNQNNVFITAEQAQSEKECLE